MTAECAKITEKLFVGQAVEYDDPWLNSGVDGKILREMSDEEFWGDVFYLAVETPSYDEDIPQVIDVMVEDMDNVRTLEQLFAYVNDRVDQWDSIFFYNSDHESIYPRYLPRHIFCEKYNYNYTFTHRVNCLYREDEGESHPTVVGIFNPFSGTPYVDFEQWYKNGKLHRLNGPAYSSQGHDDTHQKNEYYIEGKFFYRDDYVMLREWLLTPGNEDFPMEWGMLALGIKNH